MMKVLALNCTLKAGKTKSSTDRLLGEVLEALTRYDVAGEIVRVANFNVKPGVKSDEGHGDEWPAIRKKIVACDILIVGTPIWMGQPSSIAKRICERMDAFLGEKDANDRLPSYGKVAGVAVVGNEDGAHHVCAELFQSLNDVGFTIAANGCTYWVGTAMGSVDYIDLKSTPRVVNNATQMMARNSVHLAQLLAQARYPGK